MQNLKFYEKCLLSSESTYVTVGDIHGCYGEFVSLLVKNDFMITDEGILEDKLKDGENRKIILVGDYIDKGPKIKEVVDLIHKNKELFKIVLGNHENFIYKFFKGKIGKNVVPKNILENYFNSIKLFEDDEDFKTKFFDLVENHSFPFLKHKLFIVTHAPCLVMYLGKTDKVSLKFQRKFDSPRRGDFPNLAEYVKAYEKNIFFLKSEGVCNQPFHIFGHDTFSEVFFQKNKIGLDTGCACGGKLSSVVIKDSSKPFFASVPSSCANTKELFVLFNEPVPKTT